MGVGSGEPASPSAELGDPLVHAVVHPYWFMKHEFDSKGFPWFDSMKLVPESTVRELGQVARDTGTAIEINGNASLPASAPEEWRKSYYDFLAILADEGVLFSVGSDAHDIKNIAGVSTAWQAVDALGLPPDRIWRPPVPPIVGGEEQ